MSRLRNTFDTAGPVPGKANTPMPVTLSLNCVPPYSWGAMLSFFRMRAIAGVESADETTYRRTVVIDGEPGTVCVRAGGDNATLQVDVYLDTAVPTQPLMQTLGDMFDTGADLACINSVLESDVMLRDVSRNAAAIRVAGAWDRFELIIRAILGQQVTVAAGRTLSARLCVAFGSRLRRAVNDDRQLTHLFPTPRQLAGADVQQIGMPARRAESIRLVARAVIDGRLDLQADADGMEKTLLAISGIGPWTAGYVRMRAWKDPDAFPAADIALLNAARNLNIATTHRELLAAASAWQPWRAYATVRLWHSLGMK